MDHMGWRQGARLTFVQRAVARALDSVGASAAQEAKVHDIVAAKFAEIAPKPDDHEAMRKQALDLLAAPTIDRAAVERLRVDAVATFDAKSKAVRRRPARRRRPAHAGAARATRRRGRRHGAPRPDDGRVGGPHDRLFDGPGATAP